MIAIQFHGRLGNQLFQYAFAVETAKKLKTSFVFDEFIDNNLISQFFDLDKTYYSAFGRIRRRFKKWDYHINQIGHEKPEEILANLQNHCFYKGFFQSEKYFSGIKYQLNDLIKVKQKYLSEFNRKYQKLLSEKYIAVHVRRTDYLDFGSEELGGSNLTLPVNYYKNCFENIKNIEDYKIVFVSDDVESAKNLFGLKKNYLFEQNEEIIDFLLIKNADIVCSANSSFSWWGAYLNQKKDKIVFVPAFWLGFKVKNEFPLDIIPKDWIQIKTF
jgi:hypothetical protein